jgi:hypothetical protein
MEEQPEKRAEAAAWGIPAGYWTKHWDVKERPIILLGSVFDANSLGKWIFDWTVSHWGPGTPMANVAADLWLLLISLSVKLRRAKDAVRFVGTTIEGELLRDFIEAGDRLWTRFEGLVSQCESAMWVVAKTRADRSVAMGKQAGEAFVESMFGRDRELERTEELMAGSRLWKMRFDANCADVLRRQEEEYDEE